MQRKKSKLGLIILLFLVVALSSVSIQASNESVFGRTFSSEVIEDNGVCDDGEWYLINKDCKLDIVTIFDNMWFIRLMILLTVVAFVMKSNTAPIFFVITLAMMLPTSSTIKPSEEILNTCSWSNAGACLTPSYPYIGWIIIVIAAYFLFKKFTKRKIYK